MARINRQSKIGNPKLLKLTRPLHFLLAALTCLPAANIPMKKRQSLAVTASFDSKFV
jgi:hypothetical protein